MAKRVSVSFKDNKRDDKIYAIIKSKHDQSAYIKDAIESFEEKNKSAKQQAVDEEDDIMMDIIKG